MVIALPRYPADPARTRHTLRSGLRELWPTRRLQNGVAPARVLWATLRGGESGQGLAAAGGGHGARPRARRLLRPPSGGAASYSCRTHAAVRGQLAGLRELGQAGRMQGESRVSESVPFCANAGIVCQFCSNCWHASLELTRSHCWQVHEADVPQELRALRRAGSSHGDGPASAAAATARAGSATGIAKAAAATE